MGDTQVGPEKGTVAFGSGLHGWGFNVERFAKIYASKMGVDKEKMMKRLWGDSFFNAKKKTWTNVQTPEGSTEKLPRAFCQFIMTPINQLMRAIMDDQKDKYEKMMVTLGIVLKGDEKSLTGKPLMKRTGREGGREGEGRQGVAEVGGWFEEVVEVGSSCYLHDRGERRTHHRWMWRVAY